MTHAMGIGLAAVSASELFILCLGSWLFFIKHNHTSSEAAASGIMGAFMVLAGCYQTALLIGRPSAALWAEAIAVIGAILFILKQRSNVRRGLSACVRIMINFPLASSGLISGLGYMILQGLLIPTDHGHWDVLAKMMILQRQNAVLSGVAGPVSTPPGLMELPENQVILSHLFLRNGGDYGLGLVGIAAYVTIVFATYALSRRYAWPPTAMTVTLIAISCPRFVFGATGPGLDLIPAAAAVVSLLFIYRLVEAPNGLDLCMLFLFIGFLIGDQVLWLAFPFVLLLLSIVLLFRRHGIQTWGNLISHHPWRSLMVIGAAVFLSRLWLIPLNGIRIGLWGDPGSLKTLQFNMDGIQGAAANICRYLLQSVDITAPVNTSLHWMIHVSVSEGLQQFYIAVIQPIFGHQGASAPFRLIYNATEYLAWFGPLCFLLLPVAILYGLRFAPRRLKAVLVALIGYVFLIALITAWQPDNVRYFSVFYACGIFCIAFFLPPWRLTRNSRRLLRWASIILFFYAGLFNADRPLLDFSIPEGKPVEAPEKPSHAMVRFEYKLRLALQNSIWLKSAWGKNRFYAADRFFGDNRMDQITASVLDSDQLTVFHKDTAAAFPFLMRYPEAAAVSVAGIDPNWRQLLKNAPPGYILFADTDVPESSTGKTLQVIWQAVPHGAAMPGALAKKF